MHWNNVNFIQNREGHEYNIEIDQGHTIPSAGKGGGGGKWTNALFETQFGLICIPVVPLVVIGSMTTFHSKIL